MSKTPVAELWRQYEALEAERLAIADGVTDLHDPFPRYDVIKQEQAKLRVAIGEPHFSKLAAEWLD